ncbi:MAG TPA: helix-turn-helix transcriptional regulator [Pseudonocardiaceae bacterium]
MTSSKQAFGQFVAVKRQAAGLTQRELAERLFVTESAVSKWERGLSYPDITLVDPLAAQLGVSERELLSSSDDRRGRLIERQARVYRRWRTSVLWATLLSYGTCLVVCFTVNLAVAHTLSWFWIVLTAIAVAFSLTSFPLLARRHTGWSTLAMFLVSLFALLTVVWALNGGGAWLPIPIAAVLLAVVLIFAPIWLGLLPLPAPASRHRLVISLAIDTIALAAFVLLALAVGGEFRYWAKALFIVGIAVVFPWALALAVRYLPWAGLYRAAVVTAFFGLYLYFGFAPLLGWIDHEPLTRPVDLSHWEAAYINGNVQLLVVIAAVLVAMVLAVTGAIRGLRTEDRHPR